MTQAPNLYRCDFDGELLRDRDIAKHLGHKVKFAHHGSFIEWIKIQYWKLTGGL